VSQDLRKESNGPVRVVRLKLSITERARPGRSHARKLNGLGFNHAFRTKVAAPGDGRTLRELLFGVRLSSVFKS